MQLTELEKALRTAIRRNPSQPALAGLAGNGQGSAHLPVEFDAARKSLVERLQHNGSRASTTEPATYEWM